MSSCLFLLFQLWDVVTRRFKLRRFFFVIICSDSASWIGTSGVDNDRYEHYYEQWRKSIGEAEAARSTERSRRSAGGRRRVGHRPEDGTGARDEQVHRGDRVPAGTRRADGWAVLRAWCRWMFRATDAVRALHARLNWLTRGHLLSVSPCHRCRLARLTLSSAVNYITLHYIRSYLKWPK